jgi:Fe-S oxidoreductase
LTAFESLIFAFLFLFAFGFFLRNIYRLFAIVCLGRWENRFDSLRARLKGMLVYAFLQLRVVSEKFGINHFFLFWGFMILFFANVQFLLSGLFPRFSFAFLGETLYGLLFLTADIMSLVVVVCVAISVVRRLFFRPPHIEPTLDAFFILSLVVFLMAAYFGYHACEIRLGQEEMGVWMPISHGLSRLLARTEPSAVHLLGRVSWWTHALVLLFFLNYLPYSKHLHILTAIPNCFFRSFSFVKTMPRLTFRKGLAFGVSKIVQYSWKDLFDFLSCTECGRCQAACPAHNTNKPLNPKEVVQQGKVNLLLSGKAILASRPADTLASAPEDAPMAVPLITPIDNEKDGVSVQSIWDCTTCGACMVTCPVFIEHVPKLLSLRRHLVMEKARFPSELIPLFENLEQRFNPWGIAPSERTKWVQELSVPLFSESARFEYLFFVGCAGAFDSRNRQVTAAIVRILNEAKISWGILGNEEKCCGDSLFRLGNEYVFDQLVRNNVELFSRHGIRKIITYCPHCFSTLKNDYRQFGVDLEVIHHSQFIHDLLKQRRITLSAPTGQTAIFHDSCYLGRYNDIYTQPREILEAAFGKAPKEMDRRREKSFCCGAGGGRMWMDESIGKRICVERTQEALKEDPSTIAVACPYCMAMFEVGVKDEKREDKVSIKDVAEIVSESMATNASHQDVRHGENQARGQSP